jgi:hypothetical protein
VPSLVGVGETGDFDPAQAELDYYRSVIARDNGEVTE